MGLPRPQPPAAWAAPRRAMAARALSVSGLLVFGTTTSLLSKAIYGLYGTGGEDNAHPARHAFVKPLFMTEIMFIAMCLCLPTHALVRYCQARGGRRASSSSEDEALHWNTAFLIGAPAAFDLVATVLMNFGLVFVSASVYQMMRGAEMLFAALFGVVFLRRRLALENYIGIVLAVVGIGIVGLASVLGGNEQTKSHHHDNGRHHHDKDDYDDLDDYDDYDYADVHRHHLAIDPTGLPFRSSSSLAAPHVTATQQVIGMGLIIISQAVQAGQLTFEEFFLTSMKVDALVVVGMEGVWGASLTALLLAAAQYLPAVIIPPDVGGVVENTRDTFLMIASTPLIQGILVLQALALFLYNYVGMCVTGNYSAVFRTVLETLRTVFVWAVDLILYYEHVGAAQAEGTPLGEPWTHYSVLRLVGFALLVAATLVYARGDVKTVERIEEDSMKKALLDDEQGGDDNKARPPLPNEPTPESSSSSRQGPGGPAASSPVLVARPRGDDDDDEGLVHSASASELMYSTSAGKSTLGLSAASPSGGFLHHHGGSWR